MRGKGTLGIPSSCRDSFYVLSRPGLVAKQARLQCLCTMKCLITGGNVKGKFGPALQRTM